MKLRTIADIETALAPYYAVTEATVGHDLSPERTLRLLAHIGHPERRLRVLHVAGTSGKTSTTYYAAALLGVCGQTVGHTVSPHVDSIAERVQLNGQPLETSALCRYFARYLSLIGTLADRPTWFEALIGFAYWVFAEERVDYAVIETGMGGLQDSTNVAMRADKVCVLTDIGYDHMAVLGKTLAAIAAQKAGIVHPGNVVCMYRQSPEVMQAVKFWVEQQDGAELYSFDQTTLETTVYGGSFVAGLPAYQRRNWLLAYAACRYIARRDDLPMPTAAQLATTQRLQVPGRMDIRRVGAKTVVMDGAHNAQKMKAFLESFALSYPGVRPVVLLALKQGKEVDSLAPLLARYASRVVVTTFEKAQDMPLSAIPPGDIVAVLRDYHIECTAQPDPRAAYAACLAAAQEVCVITGSFFLISQLRASYTELQ